MKVDLATNTAKTAASTFIYSPGILNNPRLVRPLQDLTLKIGVSSACLRSMTYSEEAMNSMFKYGGSPLVYVYICRAQPLALRATGHFYNSVAVILLHGIIN